MRCRSYCAGGAVLIVLAYCETGADASRRSWHFVMHAQLNQIARSIEYYEESHGQLPVESEDGRTWHDLLVEQGLAANPEPLIRIQPHRTSPVVYEPEGALRCLGPNQLDDGGSFDDVELSFNRDAAGGYWIAFSQMNWSAWYWREWRSARPHAFGRAAIIALASLVAGLTLRRWRAAILVALVSFCALFINFSGMNSFVTRWPPWVSALENTAALLSVMLTLGFLVWCVTKFAEWASELDFGRDDGHCAHCGYDLVGLACRVCPECGEEFSTDESRVASQVEPDHG